MTKNFLLMKTSKFVFLFLVIILNTDSLGAAEYKCKEGFKLSLPDEWEEIPSETIKEFTANVSKLVTKGPAPVYNYGFQSKPYSNLFELPYILVHVIETGRIPERELKKHKQVKQALEKSADSVTFLGSFKVGETIYDPDKKVLLSQMETNVIGAGKIKIYSAFFLTNKGTVNIYAYSDEDLFPKYLPKFKEIADSMVIDKSIQYKSGFLDSPMNAVYLIVGLGMVGGVVAGIIVLLKKLMTEKEVTTVKISGF